jgi:hypothetical protein
MQASGGGAGTLTPSSALGIASVLLQIPRALAVRNRMFFTGTSFCTAAGCLALLRQPHPLLTGGPLLLAALLLFWAAYSQCRRAISDKADMDLARAAA